MNNIQKSLELLTEHYLNFTKIEDKKPYLDQVWNILQKSYEIHGGIKGKGFSSKEDLLNFPDSMWKLNRQGDKITNVTIYHFKRGGNRKLVASGVVKNENGKTNQEAKLKGQESRVAELKTGRSWIEVSHSSLHAIIDILGDEWKKYIIPVKEIIKKFPDDEIIPTGNGFYKRVIGKDFIEKVAIGNINSPQIYIK